MTTRLSSAEIIAQGHYLDGGFDPSALTVAQLLGVFGYHNINYPTTYTKPKLVQLFNDEIKPNAKKFKKERLSRQNSLASEDGITDGHTGKPLSEAKSDAPARRSSRRVSRPASREPELVATKLDAPKRRRSSAEPSLGGPSRRKHTKPSEPTLVEESEPEEVVVRKVSRSKKSSADAGTQARKLAQDDVDSGWEDNNIFQSGAESSSPVRPSPIRPRTRRTSVVPTRSRKSLSAPPESLIISTKGKERAQPPRAPSVKPPESNFEPDLPPEVTRETRASSRRLGRASVAPEVPEPVVQMIVEEVIEEEEVPDTQLPPVEVESEVPAPEEPLSEEALSEPEGVESGTFEQLTEEEKVQEISRRIAGEGQIVRTTPQPTPSSLPSLYQIVAFLFTLTAGYLTYNYKVDAAQIGFCATGKTSNDVLRAQQTRWAAIDSCNRENRTYLYLPNPDGTQSVNIPTPSPTASVVSDTWAFGDEERDGKELCPAPPLLPIPHPDYCTPCPTHAVCSPATMTCETGYLIRPHPLLFFLSLSPSSNGYTVPAYMPPSSSSASTTELIYKTLSRILDGIPGLGPVALPPRCVEDPKRKARVGALGNAIETLLASHRGRLVCEGISVQPTGTEAEEAKKWGLEIDELKQNMKSAGMKKKVAPRLMEAYEDNFNEAIQQLVQWGGVFIGEDASGKRYVAHKSLKMDWTCAAKVRAREAWKQWRKQLFGILLSTLTLLTLRRRRAQNSVENQRVAGLVQTALESLRNQELAHHTDPVTAPQAFLSSLQLRDLILQDEHSVNTRRRLWERVERVVESNANVRTNLEEVSGGDEMRVWRWVGSAGKTLSSPGADSERQLQPSAADDGGEQAEA